MLLHGVPTSSFLYRKVIPVLAQQGLRGVAFDFPGLGLADRPVDFDYSWSGLARWTGEAIDALGIDRCHLVVHDIGGPIGFEWAIRNPERVHSLTAMNMMLELVGLSAALVDAPVRGPGAWPHLRCARSPRSASPRSSTYRASPTGARCRATRSTPTTSCSSAATAAAPSCGSCGASSSPRRSSAFCGRAWPSGPTRPGSCGASATRRWGSTRCGWFRGCWGSTTRSCSPPSTSSRRTRRPPSPSRSPIWPRPLG